MTDDNNISDTHEASPMHRIGDMEQPALLSNKELADLDIIYPGMTHRQLLNAFRDIRTRLLHKRVGGNFILMVSSLDEESKESNYVGLNLAASIALDENKTALYLNCNLDTPHGEQLLKSKPEIGLTDYLADDSLEASEIIYPSGVPRLRVIPVGNPKDTAEEQFASQRMKDLLESLRNRYDDRYIIIDVPPVGQSVVARIVSQLVDFAVLVVPFGKVTESQILSGVDAVSEQRFAGLVFCR